MNSGEVGGRGRGKWGREGGGRMGGRGAGGGERENESVNENKYWNLQRQSLQFGERIYRYM